MPRTDRASKVLAVVALVALLSSCAPDTVVASPDDESLRPCAPAGAAPPPLPFPAARTVAPGDLSTSVVQKVDGDPQIQCGRVELTTHTDVVYSSPTSAGADPVALTLDVLTPVTLGRKPLVIYVPGGGFVQADKGGAQGLRTYVAEAGYVVASIRYRTVSDGARYVDGLADVKSAVRFLRAHAAEYGIDPTTVALWGESAGGYLAAMTALTAGRPEFELGDNVDQSSAVTAVVDKFGPSDMSRIGADFDEETASALASPRFVSHQYFAGAPAGAADPMTLVGAGDVPFLFFHGSDDRLVSPSQTLLLHNALRAAGVDSTRYVIDGAGHGDLGASAQLWSTTTVMGDLVGFLAGTLR